MTDGNNQELVGRVALVTGSSSGIGEEVARRLSALGASVVVNYSKSKAKAINVVEKINRNGGHAIDIQAWDRGPHTNPEETAYFMRGTGEMLVGETWYKVKPGSLVYSGEGETHAIKNTKKDGFSLQYYVMEYAEQYPRVWNRSRPGHD